jgi:hypothetical protein
MGDMIKNDIFGMHDNSNYVKWRWFITILN